MPAWKADNTGKLELYFANAEDFLNTLTTVMIPIGKGLGIEVTFKQAPKGKETLLEQVRV